LTGRRAGNSKRVVGLAISGAEAGEEEGNCKSEEFHLVFVRNVVKIEGYGDRCVGGGEWKEL
jgi:hypothetical protein